MDLFLQEPPRLPSAWEGDRALRDALSFYLGNSFPDAEAILGELGRWATDPDTLTKALRAEGEPPTLKHYDAWGHRVDEIAVSDAYTELGKAGVERGVVALAYESEPFGELARLVWAATIYLWGPSSALYSCPIAMTDAAARTLLEHGDATDAEVAQRLISRDPGFAWTSGQWMTETAGGSDVGRTSTVARLQDGEWRLYGTKWFTSATTSEMALTLARPEGAPEGSRGLGLFRVHRMLDDGTPNAISVRRLKDKLGTRSMPTAELELEGAVAYPIGDPLDGRGVAKISTMLNITRLHNALASAAALARGHAWAASFAETREVFGRKLAEQPAHRATLADLAVDKTAALALSLR
jgi:acyl-CoA dehydrogenase